MDSMELNQLQEENARLKAELQHMREQQNMVTTNSDIILWGANAAFWDWDYQTGRVQCSDNKLDFLGFQKDEVERHIEFFTKRIHPEDYKQTMDSMRAMLEGKTKSWECEYRIRRKDGIYIWFQDKGKITQRDKDGKPLRIVGVTNHISTKREYISSLKESEARYRSLFENSAMGIRIVDEKGQVIGENESLVKLTGYTAQETIGKYIWDVVLRQTPPEKRTDELRQKLEKGIRIALITGTFGLDNEPKKQTLITKSGEERVVLASYFHIQTEGKYLYYGIITDITEQERNKQNLLKEQEYQNNILKGTNAGTWRWNVQSGETIFNERWAEMIGYALSDIKPVMQSWSENVHPDDLPRCFELLQKHFIKQLDYYDVEFRMKHKKGHWVWIQARGKLLSRTSDDKPLLMFGTHLDITDRKLNEIKLQEHLAELEAINKNIKIAIWRLIFNPDGSLLKGTISKGANEILGLEEGTMINDWAKFFSFVHPDYYELLMQKIKDGLNVPGQTVHLEYKIIKADGSEAWLSSVGSAIDEDGILVGYGTTIDVTEKKQAEAEREQLLALIENSDDIIVVKDKNRRVLAANMSFVKAGGKNSISEMIGKTDAEIFGVPEDSELVNSYAKDDLAALKMRKGDIIVREEPVIFPDGEKRIFLTRKFPIYSKDSKTVSIGVVSTDISEIRKTEEKLVQREQSLRTLFNAMEDIVFEIDYNGTYLNIAPTSPQLMYKEAGQMIGKTLFDAFEKPMAEKFLRFVRSVMDENTTKTIEYPLFMNGKTLWFSGKGTPKSESTILYIAHEITARKRAEERINMLNERMKIAADAAGTGIWDYDLINDVLIWDEWMFRIYGVQPGNFTGNFDFWLQMVHPEDRTESQQKVELAVAERKILDFSFRIVRPDGEIRFVRAFAQIKFNEEGKALRLIGSNHDITEQKKYEERIALFKKAVEQSPVSIVMTDPEGAIKYVNTGFESVTGYKRKEVIGQNPRILKSGKQDCGFYKDFWDTLKRGEIWDGEFHNKKKNGLLFWEKAIISPVTNERNEITHFVAVKEDITHIKSMQDQLMHILSLQDILTKISSSYINIPVKNRVQAINGALKELGILAGASRATIFGYDFSRQVANNTFEWHTENVRPLKDKLQGVPLNVIPDWVRAHRNGETVLITDVLSLHGERRLKGMLKEWGVRSLIAVPMVSDDGCVGFLGFTYSETGRQFTDKEQAILKLFAQIVVNLENRYRAEKSLTEAKIKAEESDRLKSAFLANMSHEIRTPLNGILGFLDLLDDPNLDEQNRDEFVDIIQKSSDRLLNTMRDIIEISRIETGQVSVRYEELDVYALMQRLYNSFQQGARAKGLQMYMENGQSGDCPVYITSDFNKLLAVLTNLIKNAIKYTLEGEIKFGCIRRDAAIEFFVRDTGIGVPDDRKDAIFNRFEQADIEDTRVFEGSGLGLAISKFYVEQLGGKIWVDSQEEISEQNIPGWSRFAFSIPLEMQGDVPGFSREATWHNKNIMDQGDILLKNTTVLLVEDEPSSIDFLEFVLKRTVQKVITVKSGTAAVEVFKNTPQIDLILMDLKLPGISGFEATKSIREFDKNVPIIAQTAFAMSGDKEKALQAGCDAYLSKPIKKEKLIRQMSDLLLNVQK